MICKLSDEDIVAALKGDRGLSIEENLSVLEEIRYLRKLARGESRRADQVRRLRWAVETMIMKTEEMRDRIAELTTTIDNERTEAALAEMPNCD